MKAYVISLCLSVALTCAAASFAQRPETKQPSAANAATETVKRGAPLGDSPAVALADVLKEPQKYAGKPVIVERACTRAGCWMEIAPKTGAEGVRVTFKDYGFFVPLNSKGMKVRAEGEFAVRQLSKADADHYEQEGARLKRNADGTADEVSFVASGVELRK
jgi:hypothetical protein